MANSQNGWPVDRTGAQQDRSAVAGVTFPNGVRRGDVATVLHYVAYRFHREVEPLHAGWCWGWYVKNIEGSSAISNHASGTAIDLNAPSHPIGRRGTFSAAKVRAIRRILADCDGVVRWGGDYTGRADEMHFEIIKGAAAVAALARKIRAEENPVTQPAPPTAAQVADAVWAKIMQIPGTTGTSGQRSAGTLLQYLYSKESIAARVLELLHGDPATGGTEGTPLYELADEVRKVREALDVLLRDPADTGNPEGHPIVMAMRYVQNNPPVA